MLSIGLEMTGFSEGERLKEVDLSGNKGGRTGKNSNFHDDKHSLKDSLSRGNRANIAVDGKKRSSTVREYNKS